MMEQPSGEPHLANNFPPGGGGLPPPAPPPGGGNFGGGPPGGYGPPGGAPPGGFGGPPPGGFGGGPPGGDGGGGGYGGPPGGGGFGGPPGGGGFGGPPGGAPPGGGGFGGPPGGPPGGGYGPPQGGGYGPPQGQNFGGPPMGAPMGGAPMGGPQPPQKKTNVGLIVGLGCLGLLVVGVIVVVGGIWYTGKKAAEAISAIPLDSANPNGPTLGDLADLKPPKEGDLKAELKDLKNYKADYGDTIHFVGELYNTGKDPIGIPNVKVTFLDASNTAIDSGTCSSIIRELSPGEKVPCTFSLFKTKTWSTYKIESNPMRPFFTGKPAKLKISDTKFTLKKGFNPHTVEGKITNESAFKAKGVWAIVSLYDKDGKICGADNALVAGNDLDAGSGGIFSAKIYSVAATPETFRVMAVGYGD